MGQKTLVEKIHWLLDRAETIPQTEWILIYSLGPSKKPTGISVQIPSIRTRMDLYSWSGHIFGSPQTTHGINAEIVGREACYRLKTEPGLLGILNNYFIVDLTEGRQEQEKISMRNYNSLASRIDRLVQAGLKTKTE